MNYLDEFERIYKRQPDNIAFCPYRICPIGAHVDHQYGYINGMAINYGIHIAYSIKHNGVIEMCSLNFDKRAQFHVSAVPDIKVNDWADYLRGATRILKDFYSLKNGICGVIQGDLPIGGLSSSAALTIAFLEALCKVNDIKLSDRELIFIAKKAENDYVGVLCGNLDQSCEVLCKKNHLLYLDTKDESYELIPTSKNIKPYKIGVIFSGLERSLINSKYNVRQDECKSAAYALMAYAGMKYEKFEEARLRNISIDVFEKYKERLPENWRKRAIHFYEENERAKLGAKAWKDGNIEEYGRLIFESGYSSIYNYESGSEELKTLYNIMLSTKGVYGGRFSGAGFKGCCIAFLNPEYIEEIEYNLRTKYLMQYPNLENKYSFHICESADGVNI